MQNSLQFQLIVKDWQMPSLERKKKKRNTMKNKNIRNIKQDSQKNNIINN